MKVYAKVEKQEDGSYVLNTVSLTCPVGLFIYKLDIPYGQEPTLFSARIVAGAELVKILSARVVVDGITIYPKGASL